MAFTSRPTSTQGVLHVARVPVGREVALNAKHQPIARKVRKAAALKLHSEV